MWKQLSQVKESKGHLGVLATQRALYEASAIEGFEMIEHISNLRKLQEELHLMESLITDEDFVMILITSLPESWDNYTSAYLGSSGNKLTLTSHELIVILLEEDRRRKESEILPAPRYMPQDIPKWEVTSDVQARAWPKALAWAGLEWAQACKNPEPGPKPELGLGQARLGLEPGLFTY
jgi:hypothetical protein